MCEMRETWHVCILVLVLSRGPSLFVTNARAMYVHAL